MRRFAGLLIVLLLLPSCTTYKKTALEEDFINGYEDTDEKTLRDRIDAIQDSLRFDYENPSLHRQLAIFYRLQATPYSRALAIEEIEKAISLEPDDPLNQIELGLTYYAMRFTGEAEAAFRRALRIDPGSFDAWYQMARIEKAKYLKNMCFVDYIEKSINYYKKAYNIDNRHEETLFNLSFLHLLRRMTRSSRKYASKVLEYYPENPRNHLLMGSVQFRLGEFDAALQSFKRGISLMDDEEKSPYLDTAPLLQQSEKDRYLCWPDGEKESWNRKFWLLNDPTPATETNERLLSHYDRVFFAKELLTLRRLGLDGVETARGQALIRYGLPDKFLYNLGGGIHGPFVIWEYNRSGAAFRLYFQDEFLNGNYHIPIDPAFMDLADMTQSVLDNIPQAYEYPVLYIPAPVMVGHAQTRTGKDWTSLEFSIAFPDSAVEKPGSPFDLTFSIFDNEWNRIRNETIKIRPDTLFTFEKQGRPYYLYTFNIAMMPRIGDCTFAMELTGGRPFRRGSWKSYFPIRDLGGNTLKTSDIRFSLPLEGANCAGPLDPVPSYGPGASLCLSYEIYNLTRNRHNMSRYRLTYSIMDPGRNGEDLEGIRKTLWWIARSVRGAGEQAPYISSTLEQSVNSSMISDNLEIDTSSLAPGKYLLRLLIEDLTDNESCSTEKEFIITD